jgi:hypothetical protein
MPVIDEGYVLTIKKLNWEMNSMRFYYNMSTHFGCGAFIIDTTTFVLPDKAIKRAKYQCPSCLGPVIFRKGEIKAPHFAHHAFSPCKRYSTNTACESPQHEEAKYNFRTELYEHREMDIYRTCRQ